jgi:hypothetical protein
MNGHERLLPSRSTYPVTRDAEPLPRSFYFDGTWPLPRSVVVCFEST